jgi:hypothetical protein
MYSIKWFSNIPYTCDMSKKKTRMFKKKMYHMWNVHKKKCYKNCFDMYVYNKRIKNSISTGSPPPLLDDLLLHIQ